MLNKAESKIPLIKINSKTETSEIRTTNLKTRLKITSKVENLHDKRETLKEELIDICLDSNKPQISNTVLKELFKKAAKNDYFSNVLKEVNNAKEDEKHEAAFKDAPHRNIS